MAAALPVVATEVGGVPDVISQGCTGILVPSGAVQPLADAMLALAQAPGERERLGVAARAAARGRFDAGRLVSDIAALYVSELRAKRQR
jgi:glycosyltransferase involved in cell wall biosynthesis